MPISILHIRLVVLALCGLALGGSAPAMQFAQPLIITHGGTYSGTYSTITIRGTDGTPVIIDRATLVGPGDLITQNVPCDLTVRNTVGSTPAPGKFLIAWQFINLTVEHNLLNGTAGVLVCDERHTARHAHISYNRGNNITGAVGPATTEKTSFIQFQNVHISDLEVAWNHVYNQSGNSAVEDNIALMRSGGTLAHPAIIHDNFVDGAFAYPAGSRFTGSGIMCFDPGAAKDVMVGGYTIVCNNQVVASENQGIVCAGGHDIEVYGNRAVNDGTTTGTTTFGYQVFDWAGKTPAEAFGQRISIHGNFSYWTDGSVERRSDWSIAPPATSSANIAGMSTDNDERNLWIEKCRSTNICVGLLPTDQHRER